jgi:hypothetical protein
MCGLVLLILGIIYATRIPKFLRSTPAEFPGCDPAVHARWRSKELGSIYTFLIATWGQMALFLVIGFCIGVALARDQEALNSAIVVITGVEVAVFLGGLIWAAILGSQAAKLKKQLGLLAVIPPSYYPRPNQELLQAPPPNMPAVTPVEPPAPPTDPPQDAPGV